MKTDADTTLEGSTRLTTRILTWSGVIPFVALSLAAVTPLAPDWIELLLQAYPPLILSFLAGTLWSRHLLGQPAHPRLLIASNVLVLAAWPSILLPVSWACLWLAVLFGVHLLLDEPWRGHGMPGWYRRLRLAVSLTAISLLLLGGLIGIRLDG